MNYDHVARTLCALPSGTKATITVHTGKTLKGEARDRPTEGRRWTVDGWEWFITPESLENVGVTKVTVEAFDL